MGMNSHILPGDLVEVLNFRGRAILKRVHPDLASPMILNGDKDFVCYLDEGDLCLVLSVSPAGSSQTGHAFYVVSAQQRKFGWLCNYEVSTFVTKRSPC